jgi:hypothetical protein
MLGDAVARLESGVLTLTVDLRPKEKPPPEATRPAPPGS